MDPEKLVKWRKLCQELVEFSKTCPVGSIASYAGSYAMTGKSFNDPDDISTQAIYIANNIKHLRGPKGKDFKQRLREFY